MESLVATAFVLAGAWLSSWGRRAPRADDAVKRLRKALSPPTYRVKRVQGPITVHLSDAHSCLPVEGYPSRAGLADLARFYKPHMPYLGKHKEWVPGCEGHAHLFSATARRTNIAGNLFEKHRALSRVYELVIGENASLFAEISRLRSLLDGATQQEELLKETCQRERELRKAAERDKAFVLATKSELEEQLLARMADVQQLQALLQQAAQAQQSEVYYGSTTTFRQQRVGV